MREQKRATILKEKRASSGTASAPRVIVYWASVFKLLKIFLGVSMNIRDLQRGKAKIAWKEVCQPKQNRGLRLKPLESWNNAFVLKHLWNVVNKKDSLWVKWISTVKLKGKSVWEVEKLNNDNWIWRSPLDLRIRARENIAYKIGNGKKASVWPDRWSDKPSLDSITPITKGQELQSSQRCRGVMEDYNEHQVK
nr:hypothetical protein [Tanacetum cinerariifolium]